MRTSMLGLAACLLCAGGAAFASPFQVGDIFISGADGNVRRYNQSGTLLQTIPAGATAYGLAFDSSGNLYVATGTSIVKFDSSGTPLGTFASGFPGLGTATDIDFDNSGLAYVVGIQDLNNDFISKYSSSGAFLATNSIIEGQENWVYVDFTGSRLLMTPGTTSLVDPIDPATLVPGASYIIPGGGPNGDVEGVGATGFLVISANGVEQFNGAGTLIFTYNPSLSGTFIGVDSGAGSQFWAVSDFGEVREFNLGVAAPIASFNTGNGSRAIAVFEGAAVPEPYTLGGLAAVLGVLAFFRARRPEPCRLPASTALVHTE